MTNKIIRHFTSRKRLAPGLAATFVFSAYIVLEFTVLDAFKDVNFIFADIIWLAFCLLGLVILGIRNLVLFFGGVKFGTGKECMKAYNIDLKDLDADMENAENVDNLFVGKKYFLCACKEPLIMPLDRLVVVHPKTMVMFGEAYDDMTVYANSTHILLTDDVEKTRPFETYKKKERVEDRIDHLKLILGLFRNADSAILTPLDHEYWEWIKRYNENFDKAMSIVKKRRENPKEVEKIEPALTEYVVRNDLER